MKEVLLSLELRNAMQIVQEYIIRLRARADHFKTEAEKASHLFREIDANKTGAEGVTRISSSGPPLALM